MQVSLQAPAGTVWAAVDTGFHIVHVGETGEFYGDAISLTPSANAYRYFDGDSPGGSWSFIRGNSSSTGYPWIQW